MPIKPGSLTLYPLPLQQLSVNGDVVDTSLVSENTAGFSTYDITLVGVNSLLLEPVGLEQNEWISFLEVRGAYIYVLIVHTLS